MKPLLVQYASFNVWANHKLLFAIQQLDENLWYQQTPSSFNSLFKTVLHIWDAEAIWFQRMRLNERLVVPSANFDPGFKDACNGLLQQSMQWEELIKSDVMDAETIASQLMYSNSRGDNFQQPVWEVLMHVFNHGTYHRGQMVTMLRAMGEKHIPATDFIVWSRTERAL